MLNFAVIGVILIPLYFIILFVNIKKKKTFFEHLIFTTFYVYISLIIKVTLFQIPIDESFLNSLRSMGSHYSLNVMPFKSIYGFYLEGNPKVFLTQVGGNILMFIPFGTYLPLITRKSSSFGRTLAFTVWLSVAIELAQAVISLLIEFNYRSVDIDDVILNLMGGMLGYVFYKLVIAPKLSNHSWLIKRGVSLKHQ